LRKAGTSEIIEAPTAFVVTCGLISLAILLAVVPLLLLWHASTPQRDHVRDVSGALSPFLTLLTVIIAVAGWGETARRNGDEARKTERMKQTFEREQQNLANQAFRGHLEARLIRVWSAISEGVSGVKPYTPRAIEHFIVEVEGLYWSSPTFAAFTKPERSRIEDVLYKCRLGNRIADKWSEEYNSSSESLPFVLGIGDRFLTPMAALEFMFSDVFGDEKLATEIRGIHNSIQIRVDDAFARGRP